MAVLLTLASLPFHVLHTPCCCSQCSMLLVSPALSLSKKREMAYPVRAMSVPNGELLASWGVPLLQGGAPFGLLDQDIPGLMHIDRIQAHLAHFELEPRHHV